MQTPNPARAVESPASPAAGQDAMAPVDLIDECERVDSAVIAAALYSPDGARKTALWIALEFCEQAPATMTLAHAAKWLRAMVECDE